MKPKVRRMSYWIMLLVVTGMFAAMLFICPDGIGEGIHNGLTLCATVILPSMFPFMVLSAFLVKSGLALRIGRVLEKPTRLLFGLPGCAATAILMSMIGGYPVGAKAVSELKESGELTESQCSRMFCFCVNAGPAFLIFAVGANMLGSVQIGVILYVSQLIASLLIGIGSRFVLKEKGEAKAPPCQVRKRQSAIDAFVNAVADTAKSMLTVCAFVALFAALLGGFSRLGVTEQVGLILQNVFQTLHLPGELARAVLPSLLEVTSGCAAAASATGAAIVFISAAAGWSGLSVHFQVLSLGLRHHVSKSAFWLGRAMAAALAAAITALLLHCFPVELPTMAIETSTVPTALSSSAPASIFLLLFSAAMVLVSPQNALEFEHVRAIIKKNR